MRSHHILLLSFLICSAQFLAAQTDANGSIKRGVLLFDQGQFEAAKEHFERALEYSPDNTEAMYELAYTEFVLENYEDCLKWTDQVIDGDDVESKKLSYILQGNALDQMGKPKKAIKTFKKAGKAFPEDHLIPYNLAVTYLNQESFDKGEEALIRSLSLNPLHSSSHYLMGQLQMIKSQRIQAIMALQFFLVLEARSDRSTDARDRLNYLFGIGIEQKDDQNVSISINPDMFESEFGSKEMLFSLRAARILSIPNDSLNLAEKDLELTKTALCNMSPDKKSFWKQTYATFFNKCEEDEQFEAMFYHSRSGSIKDEYQSWMRLNSKAMQDFYTWLEGLYR